MTDPLCLCVVKAVTKALRVADSGTNVRHPDKHSFGGIMIKHATPRNRVWVFSLLLAKHFELETAPLLF